MFKEMRKKSRELTRDEIEVILKEGEYGVLSTVGDNGYPYSLPVSYAYIDDAIYFHCAMEGQKLDNIKNNNKVSFSVVTDTEIIEDKFTTKFKSVVIFGEANLANDDEKVKGLLGLIEKYSPNYIEEGKAYIERGKKVTTVVKIKIDHITGKGKK